MDCKLDIDTVGHASLGNVTDSILCPGDSHTIPRHDDHFARLREHGCNCFRVSLLVLLWTLVSFGHRTGGSVPAENNIEDVPVHAVAHDLCKDSSGETNQTAHDR